MMAFAFSSESSPARLQQSDANQLLDCRLTGSYPASTAGLVPISRLVFTNAFASLGLQWRSARVATQRPIDPAHLEQSILARG